MKGALQFYINQLKPIVGGRIEGLARDADGEFFGFIVACKDGKKRTVFFLSDDEGNGPGSFDITEES